MSSTDSVEWKFSQVIDRSPADDLSDVDIVSTVEFNESGDLIATGDRGGRVVIFERDTAKSKDPNLEYKFFTEFQSHDPEFDYLKSIEIEEKINKIKWLRQTSNGHLLLTTNDKTIKLWRVYEKKLKQVNSTNIVNGNHYSLSSGTDSLRVPQLEGDETTIAAAGRRVYANAHTYHINSISVNSDGETYISSDDLRVNLWSLAVANQSFNIVDIKPANMEELTEVITSAEFHPQHCHIFMYSSSKGTIKLADMRSAALCDNHAKVLEVREDPATRSFFSEIISSISDIKFSQDGRYILSRDYLTLKLWDVNMDHAPVRTIHVHDYLRPKLCDLYENDFIFDKFECALSRDGSQVVTGSYHNYFHIYGRDSNNHQNLEASKYAHKLKNKNLKLKLSRRKDRAPNDINPETIDFTKKALHVAWHPKENVVAVGTGANLYFYNT